MGILSLLFGLSLALSVSGALIFGSLLFIALMVRAAREKKWGGPPDVIEKFVWCLFVWATLTSVWRWEGNLGEILSWQSAFLVYFMAARFMRAEEIQKLLGGYLGASVFAGALGFVQTLTGVVYDPHARTYEHPAWMSNWPPTLYHYLAVNLDRAQGTRSHPLTFAETLMPAALLLAACFLNAIREKKDRRQIIKPLAGFLIIMMGLVSSQSRGVWLGIGAGLFILSFILPLRSRLVGGALALGAVAILLTVSPLYRHRVFSIVSLEAGRDSDRLSGQTRFELWRQSRAHIREKPWTGWGLKKAVLETIDPVFNTPKTWTESHDIYLQTAMESGLVGLLFFLVILLGALRASGRCPFPENFVLIAFVLAFLIAGITESWTRDKEVALIFWGLIGFISSRGRRAEAS
jgi:hypothetical protein